MYCGSCMHDNTLVAALSRVGVDVQLIPTYTPIRTDEEDVSVDRIFFGGVNVYLQQKFSLFRHLPLFLDRVLDQRWFLRIVTSRASAMDYRELGALTVSMLRGTHGFQRKEVRRLCRWLATSVKPDLVNLTNMLIGGCIPEIRRTLSVPVMVNLQGDDVFLEQLPEPFRSQAFDEIRNLVGEVDGFIVNSRFYQQFMADYFHIPEEKFHIVPLGIETQGFPEPPAAAPLARANDRPPTVGYFARLAPEKGLHLLVDAFLQLKKQPSMADAQLHIAGWLGANERRYADGEFAKLHSAAVDEDFRYFGSVDRAGKLAFLSGIDLLCVPTTYKEPKGIFVLEGLAAGVPYLQPDHGAFPELLAAFGGGFLCPPNDAEALAEKLAELLADRDRLAETGWTGMKVVHEKYNAQEMARRVLDVYHRFPRDVAER